MLVNLRSGMSLSVGYFGSWKIPRRESFNSELRGLSNRACTSLKALGESRRAWISSAGFVEFRQFQQPDRSLGFTLQPVQLNKQSTLANGEVIACSDVAKGILQFFGRTLFILGLGLSLSLPASARTVAPPVSEVPAGDFQKNTIQRGEVARERNEDVDALYSQEDAPHESSEQTQPSMSSEADTGETIEGLHFSEAFWRGIPTPEGSFMHRLKHQLNENPSDVMALEALLQAVLEQRDMLRALTVVETLLEVQPNNLEWKFLKARTHEFLGELLMAKQEYEELLTLHPLSARFLQGLVKLLNGVGEQTQAVELIKQALNKAISEGKNVEARNLGVLLGQFYIQLGKFEEALHHLSNMIDEEPDDFRPHLCQGLAYAFMKEIDKARQSFKKYLQLCPPDAFDQNYLDNLLLRAQTGKRVDALKNMAMKSTSKNRKKAKSMKQPSIFGNPKLHDEEDYAD